MSARRIARELAVILLPQLPKDKKKLEKVELDAYVSKAVLMLTDYAKQSLADANSFILKAQEALVEQEVDAPENAREVDELHSVKLTSTQIREHLDLMDRALHLTSEALDIPQMRVESQDTQFLHLLVGTYIDHRDEIDQFINRVKEKWRVERMVSIDRDIIRLACAEAFFIRDIPINVAISEAVELSHRFADQRAAKFINGILADLGEEAKTFRRTGEFGKAEPVEEAVEPSGEEDHTTSAQR
jgi:transcription antitermination protein NusB